MTGSPHDSAIITPLFPVRREERQRATAAKAAAALATTTIAPAYRRRCTYARERVCVVARLTRVRFNAQPAAAAVAGRRCCSTAQKPVALWSLSLSRARARVLCPARRAAAVRLAIAWRVIFGQAGDHAGADSECVCVCGSPKGSRAELSAGAPLYVMLCCERSGGGWGKRIYGLRCGECCWSIG